MDDREVYSLGDSDMVAAFPKSRLSGGTRLRGAGFRR